MIIEVESVYEEERKSIDNYSESGESEGEYNKTKSVKRRIDAIKNILMEDQFMTEQVNKQNMFDGLDDNIALSENHGSYKSIRSSMKSNDSRIKKMQQRMDKNNSVQNQDPKYKTQVINFLP